MFTFLASAVLPRTPFQVSRGGLDSEGGSVTGTAPLFVAVAEVELHLPGARSLKDKRHDVRSLVERLRHRLTVLVVESDHQDLHQRAGLALSALATEAEAARGTLMRALDLVHESFPGVVLDEHVSVVQVR